MPADVTKLPKVAVELDSSVGSGSSMRETDVSKDEVLEDDGRPDLTWQSQGSCR